MIPELQGILETQRAWAAQCGIQLEESGHTPNLSSNLFREPSPATRGELETATHRPLGGGAKPGDLQLLESTLALVCNVFDTGRETPGALAAACGGSRLSTRLRFCAPVGSKPLPCEVDVLFDSDSAAVRPLAVRASYAEPYQSRRPYREPANRVPAEWVEAVGLWAELPACRALANDLRATPRRFEHLPVAELLSCSASLTQRYGRRGFRLAHLWHPIPGRAASSYQRELDRFRFRVGGEIDFQSLTWQQLWGRLSEADDATPGHLDYLRDRYAL